MPTEPPADLVSVEANVDGGRKRLRTVFLTRDASLRTPGFARQAKSRGSLQRIADAGRYFIDGITIPRRITFWQVMKTIAVGMDAIVNAAMMTCGCAAQALCISKSHTARVQ
jgi:hypothetical protein